MLNLELSAKLINDIEAVVLDGYHGGCVSVSNLVSDLREKGWKNLSADFKRALEDGRWLPEGIRVTDTAYRYGRGSSQIRMNGTFFTMGDTDENLTEANGQ